MPQLNHSNALSFPWSSPLKFPRNVPNAFREGPGREESRQQRGTNIPPPLTTSPLLVLTLLSSGLLTTVTGALIIPLRLCRVADSCHLPPWGRRVINSIHPPSPRSVCTVPPRPCFRHSRCHNHAVSTNICSLSDESKRPGPVTHSRSPPSCPPLTSTHSPTANGYAPGVKGDRAQEVNRNTARI